jgi:putative transposase
MLKAYKYRLYPSSEQRAKIDLTIDACRLIYNLALETKLYAWRSARIELSAYDLKNQLPELKNTHTWLKDVDSQAIGMSIINMDKAFKNFHNGGGFPRFKSKRKGVKSFQCPNNKREIDWDKETLTIPKVANIPIRLSRHFEGQIKTVTISKTPTGKYFASILVDNNTELPAKPAITEKSTIGIDVGIKSFVVTSDGRQFEPNRKLKSNLKRLQCLQRRASRKQKGGNNRRKANLYVAALHEKITNQRTDYIHQITTRLIRDNQTESIVIEDLSVIGMLKNGNLAQAISDVSFGKFFEVLKYKCEWYSKNLIVIDRWSPSSKRCSCCGAINNALTLADREWMCCECDANHDRDLNAANNIKWFGLEKHSGAGSSGGPMEPR